MKRMQVKKSPTGSFKCLAPCGWRKATTLFWLKAVDFVMVNRCPKCRERIAFCQTFAQYLANTGRG